MSRLLLPTAIFCLYSLLREFPNLTKVREKGTRGGADDFEWKSVFATTSTMRKGTQFRIRV